ncbi:MAG: PLP-dependent aminotransferase family protein [Opitutae bacterium]|nr:PLP-dependent aminotransferase family protein [Opitutae bacterium]
MLPTTAPARPALPLSTLGVRARQPAVAVLMRKALENPALLSLAAGFTDNTTLPGAEFVAAAQALAARRGEPEYLNYGTTQGRPQLRRLLAQRLAHWEPTLAAADYEGRCLVTTGSQQALYLAVQSLCDPGDIVLVDRPSYFAFLEILTSLGARPKSLPFDETGALRIGELHRLLDELARTGEIARVKAVYFVSYFSNPSGRSLGESDKAALGRVLAEHGVIVPVIEDAAYRELYFDTPHPARCVLTLPEWAAFPKLYALTLTKPFATGGKVGYAFCTDAVWLEQLLAIKGPQDFGSANYNQALFEEILLAGGFADHLPKVRRGYATKMRALHGALLAEGLRELGWHWEEPAGGMYLWLCAPTGFDTGMDGEFCRACVAAGVLYVPGEMCFGDRPARHFIRASCGVLSPDQLREAAKRFVQVARQFSLKK